MSYCRYNQIILSALTTNICSSLCASPKRVCVCVSVRIITDKLLIRDSCDLVGICIMMAGRSVQVLVACDLDFDLKR